MMKQFIILLFLLVNKFSDTSVISPEYSGSYLTATEKMLIHILKECNLGFNNTIFYTGNNPALTQALLTTQSSVDLESWSLISHTMDDRFGNLIAKSGIVVVFNSSYEYKNLRHIMNYWRCSEDCKVIFLSKMLDSCYYVMHTLMYLESSYFEISYYICFHKNYGPVVFTRDKYRSIQRRYWHRLTAEVESLYDGSFYIRKDNKDLCRNFNFKQKKPPKNPYILLGVIRKVGNKANMEEDFTFDGDVSRLPSSLIHWSIPILEKLLKIKFATYVKSYLLKKTGKTEKLTPFFWSSTSVDVMGIPNNLILDVKHAYSHPVHFDTHIILSHKPAEATPLQKIAKFYGLWTLISLIILLFITFVVIYLNSNRNANLAAFDVLRLLINSGVNIPINTLSLKIFFCMVFLYFTVIHATFSGNLPRFLTIPEFHDTIDSLEDLLNPRITTIYDRVFFNEISEIEDEVKRKIKDFDHHNDYFVHFIAEKNSVYIVDKASAEFFMSNLGKSINELHISNDVGNAVFPLVIRPRFYLREKMQWATAYIHDVGLNYKLHLSLHKARRMITKQYITSEIEFRIISVNDLKFAFVFLAIGNTVGLVCFLIELVVGKKYYQRISFEFLKRCTTLKRKKSRMNIRRIEVRPKLDLTLID